MRQAVEVAPPSSARGDSATGELVESLETLEQADTIVSVEIVRHDVFDEAGGRARGGRKFANKLHVQTREHVVRRELLFAVGDRVDAEHLAQTERNLRALPFLRDARVEKTAAAAAIGDAGPPVGVHVRVTTWDNWTTSPEIQFGSVGDRTLWTLGFTEKNLAGLGKEINVFRRQDLERNETGLTYGDPRLGGSRFRLAAAYGNRSDGNRVALRLERPFYALDAIWSMAARAESWEQIDPLYESADRVGGLAHARDWYDLEYARAVGHGESSAIRLHTAYRRRRDEVAGDLRDFGILEVGLSRVEHRFVKLTHVNRFEVAEDFNLGSETRASLGVSIDWLGGERSTSLFFRLSHSGGVLLRPARFVRGQVSWSARQRDDELQNSLLSARLSYVDRLAARNLLVAKAVLEHGSRLDPERQITLGAHNGLRGYAVHQWVGDRSMLLTLEDRWFFVDEFIQVLSLGAAVFVDSGYAWPGGQSLALGDLRTNVGAGLLVARNRLVTNQPTFRFDLAYGLSEVTGRSRWVLTVGSEIEV